jgi:hypothetical protein
MKVRTSAMRGFALMALSALAFTACEDKSTQPIITPEVTVTVVPSSATLVVGQSQDFAAVVANADDTSVTWSSSNDAVATVSAAGRVTAVTPGSVIIRATSNQNPAVFGAASVVVQPDPGAQVTIQLVPAEASVVVGDSVQLVTIIGGTTNTAATYTTSSAAVATVDGDGTVFGVSTGTAVITARSDADPTKVATSVITVIAAAPPPSISIQNVAPLGANNTVSGTIQARINVSADVSHDVRRVEVRLGGIEVCSQTFSQPLGTTQGVAEIDCQINTNAVDEDGVPLFPNGTYELTAVAINGAGEVVAEASFGNLNVQNVNTVNLEMTTEGVTSDGTSVGDDGLLWHEGNVVVTARPALFTGGEAASVRICIATAGTSAPGSTSGTSCKTITTGANNAFVATFNKSQVVGGTTNGVQNVSNDSVIAYVTATTLTTGQPGPTVAAGSGAWIRLDNLAPTFDAAMPGGIDYLSAAFMFTSTSGAGNGTQTATNVVDPQPGVGNVTVTFHVVPTSEAGSNTAANNLAIVNDGQQVTSASELESSLTSDFYTVVVRAVDGLGNRRITRVATTFGVDLVAPTIEVVSAESPPADAINPTDVTIRVRVTDEFSGATGVTGGIIGHSVFEYNANTAVERRCYDLDGNFVGNVTTTQTCTTQAITTPVATSGAIEFYDITIPADENFYVITLQSRDSAGNLSTATITRNALVDVTAGPDAGTGLDAVTIANYTIDNVNNTATINGTIRDNIDIDEYDARFVFTGLTASDATPLPAEVPFTMPTDVGSYGLPLTALQSVSAQTAVNVDGIATTPAAGTVFTVSQFGFGVRDIADNFVFGGVAVPSGTFDGFTNFSSFDLQPSLLAIDRTPSGSASATTDLVAVATTPLGAANPLAQVYFYYVNPGSDLVYGGGDDHIVLIGSVAGSSATVLTGETVREFRYTQTLNATSLPANVSGFDFQVFAIGVAADGDAVITEVEMIDVAN